jgi:hypothetical protein
MHFLKNTAALMATCAALVACGGGGGGGGGSSPGFGSSAGPATAVSGKVTYDFVPAVPSSPPRLDYGGVQRRPARSVVVEATDSTTQQVLARSSTNAAGDYALSVPGGRTVFIRALAQFDAVGTNTAPFTVVDNTAQGALWAIDGAPFTSGSAAASLQNLHAASGWTGSAYDNTQRAAGPFAILDSLHTAAEKIISVDPAVAFPRLDINWSPNNITATGDLANGQIGFTFFTTGNINGTPVRQIYVLGYANNDTDEYDRHVVIHEFGHYLQSAFSRDDSIGGTHGGPNDRLDMRVAFAEGWGNGWSGIALNDPVYVDVQGPGQTGGSTFDISAGDPVNPGWFKEPSVEKMFWYFANSPAIGFGRVWGGLKSGLTVSPALTSIHSYTRALADANPSAASAIQAILGTQSITLTTTPYAETETYFGTPAIPDLSPIYLNYGVIGSVLSGICTNSAADPKRRGNKAGEFRYVRFNLPQPGMRAFNLTQTKADALGSGDPDFVVYGRAGQIFQSNTEVRNVENASYNLAAGDYVMVVTDFNQYVPATPNGPVNGVSCFTLTIQ